MQRFKVHSHSQAVFPYSQESTSSSLQYHTSITSVEPYLSTGINQPIIGIVHLLFIGGESILIGSIFDVVSCRLLRKLVKFDYFGAIFYNWWRKVRKIGIFANQNAYFTKYLHEDPEYSGFSP